MMLAARKKLGLAVTEDGITAVEIGTTGSRRAILRTAELPFADGVDLSQPEKLGKALRQALRAGGFSTFRCVIGLPASWLVAREKLLPATDADSLRGALSIAAEREFASGTQELVFDYSQSPTAQGLSALLMATPCQMTEKLSVMASAAGLKVTAMTSTVMALAHATEASPVLAGRLVVCLLPHGAELVAQSAGIVRLVRYLPVRLGQPDRWVDELAGELRRVVSLAPGESDSAQSQELCIWNAAGLERSAMETLGQRLGLPLRICKPASDLAMTVATSVAVDGKFAPAAALAGFAAQEQAIDFLHSRLAPRRRTRISKRVLWAGGVSLALLATVLFLLLDLRASQREVATLQAQLGSMSGSIQEAKELKGNASLAVRWYDRRPRVLECLQQTAQAFPQEGKIWATGLTLREDMQVTLPGKAVSEAAALELLDQLRANRVFSNVKPLYIRQPQSGGSTREFSFAISFVFRGVH